MQSDVRLRDGGKTKSFAAGKPQLPALDQTLCIFFLTHLDILRLDAL